MMACSNRPAALGEESWSNTDWPPADWPNTVTWSGSPPKAAALALTQRRAACWSIRP